MRDRGGYFSYTSPFTGEEIGLGRNRKHAIQVAMRGNAAALAQKPDIMDRIMGKVERSWSDWLDKYTAILDERELKDSTRRTYRSQIGRARNLWKVAVKDISTAMVADALDAIRATGKARTAQAFRTFLLDCFREAIAQGWIDRNPAEPTRAVAVKVKRARLTLEAFRGVAEASVTWLHNAVLLALVSGQRREDVAGAKFADFRDGHWWLTQNKSGKRLAIPLSLRLDVMDLTLEDVVRQCRSTGVLSPFLVHQTQDFGNSPRGRRIWVDTLSRRFTHTLEPLGFDWAGRNPPTFHEVRSLSARLYTAQGGVDVQQLLGHSEASMTEVYRDARGDWTRVKIG